MPEASSFQRAYKNTSMISDVYIVGAATNLNLIPDLKYTQEINFINYNMATEMELGHYYEYFDFESSYNSNFLFIGKNNKVIGKLGYKATQEQMENMFNLTLASFEGIYQRESIENIILQDDITTLDLSKYFYVEDGKNVEFEIISNSNQLAVAGSSNNWELELLKGDYTGSSKLTLQIKVPDKDIVYNMEFYVFNSNGKNEDFEYGTLAESTILWKNDREPWFIIEETSFTGNHSIKSGYIVDNLSSSLSLTMNVAEQDYISFAYKTSSEQDNDFLGFYINGVLMNSQDIALWSGFNDWRTVTYNLRSGIQTFTWTYSKNYLGAIWEDCVWLDAIVLPASGIEMDIENNELPSSIALSNYPNPFNPTTTIDFSLNKSSIVELNVYDMNGSLVDKLHNGFTNTGKYSFEFNGKSLSSGIYYAVLKTPEQQKISKMILVK
ncbi:MAG: T9SS type A sorting domain-containing protein [Candidatus Delongbacteria bacterium]|nr:T9SS type A sorting domain-containing protein [Candidatus Delongbacteria bacterium]